MIIDINTLRNKNRDGGDMVASGLVSSESREGFRGVSSVLQRAAEDAWHQCVVIKDYERASSRWMLAERMLRKMGATEALLDEYHDRLVAHYEQPGDALVKVDVKAPGNQIIKDQRNNYFDNDSDNDKEQ